MQLSYSAYHETTCSSLHSYCTLRISELVYYTTSIVEYSTILRVLYYEDSYNLRLPITLLPFTRPFITRATYPSCLNTWTINLSRPLASCCQKDNFSPMCLKTFSFVILSTPNFHQCPVSRTSLILVCCTWLMVPYKTTL